MRKIFALSLLVFAFLLSSPHITLAAAATGSCKCNIDIEVNDPVLSDQFDSYCGQVKASCPVCGGGKASCEINVPVSSTECEDMNKAAIKTFPYIGASAAMSVFVNASSACSFTSNQPAAKGDTAPAAAPTSSGGGKGIIPSECLGAADTTSCGLKSLVNVFVLIANFIVGISGSLALFFFIYGGFRWLASGGSPEKIKEGKTIVTNAVIGLIIIFGARAGVNFIVLAITKGSNTPIVGNSCKPTSPSPDKSIQPRWYQSETDMICVGSCEDLAGASGLPYACGMPTTGAKCVSNLCEGGKNNVCCIKDVNAQNVGVNKCSCTGPGVDKFLFNPADSSACADVSCTADLGVIPRKCTCGGKEIPLSMPDADGGMFMYTCTNIMCE